MFTKLAIITALSASTVAVGTTPQEFSAALGPLRIEMTEAEGFSTYLSKSPDFSLTADLPLVGRIRFRP